MKLTKISKKWLKMAEIYKRFAKDWPDADLSYAALEAMYKHESLGVAIQTTDKLNGFEVCFIITDEDHITELQAQLEITNHLNYFEHDLSTQYLKDIEILKAQLAAVQKDAARYQ